MKQPVLIVRDRRGYLDCVGQELGGHRRGLYARILKRFGRQSDPAFLLCVFLIGLFFAFGFLFGLDLIFFPTTRASNYRKRGYGRQNQVYTFHLSAPPLRLPEV